MRIKKIINNNILCVIDRSGHEMIVTGRGLGYQRKIGQFVDEEQVERVYRMEERGAQRRLRELVEQIPLDHLELTWQLIDSIKAQIAQPLNESLVITMADHISFAIQRKEQGIEFHNPLAGSILCYYPTEYRLGQYCLEQVEQALHVRLHPDEAAFLALHIVNAELNTTMSEVQNFTRLMDGCIQVTEAFYQRQFDRSSLDFSRFVVHIRYLIQRLYQNSPTVPGLGEKDDLFSELIRRNCARHYQCANRIAAYIETNSDKRVSEEEKIYLTIHLKRLNFNEDAGEPVE